MRGLVREALGGPVHTRVLLSDLTTAAGEERLAASRVPCVASLGSWRVFGGHGVDAWQCGVARRADGEAWM